MISRAYVFINGIEDEPLICGIVELDTARYRGRFRYGKSYLSHSAAFALDPVNLPLSDQEYSTTFQQGVFGVLSDAGPDAWGQKIILSLHRTKPQNRLEFLLAGSGMGVGALTFSLSRSATKPKINQNTLGQLPTLLQTKDAILANKTLAPEAKKVFEYGASFGGARPKTAIEHDGVSYIAKFNRPDDLFNVAAVEHASMQMLAELPCCVAHTQVLSTPNGDVLLVRRFDSEIQQPIAHYVSAHALIQIDKIRPSELNQQYSYGYLAEFSTRFSANALDPHDLYYRMVFNALMGNTDDHTRNHGFLYHFDTQQWSLAPAFDVLPINNSRQHGLGLGDAGRYATIENLMSQSLRFNIKPFKAKRIINQVSELVAQWPDYFATKGVCENDIEILKGIIPHQKWE